MTKEQLDTITRVRLTLSNGVDVRGRENMDAVLGCILLLEKLERDTLAEWAAAKKAAGESHE